MGVARRIRYQECPFKYVWRRDGTEILYQRTSSDIQMDLFSFLLNSPYSFSSSFAMKEGKTNDQKGLSL
jgi:hypothetical protein